MHNVKGSSLKKLEPFFLLFGSKMLEEPKKQMVKGVSETPLEHLYKRN